MLIYLVSFVFARIACGLAVSSDTTAPIVDLGYAQYQGYFDAQTNTTNFLGVRYAAPPVGSLRFQAPQPPATVSGVQPATQNPAQCYQGGIGVNSSAPVTSQGQNKRQTATATSEDCLFLNVWVPGTLPAEPLTTGGLPVLVWIHGGGYATGSAAKFDGSDLVADSLNTVIVVVIQYRLGAFGFLSGNEIHAHGALNAGLLDQNFALQWVQEHIESFGGDKCHVTIWGESAGGGSVLQHIIAHGGNTEPPVFNAAIASSIFLPSQHNYNDTVPQLLYNKVVNVTGCASSTNTFTCLQSVDATVLGTVNYDLSTAAYFGTFIFVPVVDGTFIVERPSVTLSKGRVNGQALLSVTNQNEGILFVDVNETLSVAGYISILFPDMTSSQLEEAASVYEGYGTPVEQAILAKGDSTFVCPTYYLLEAFSGSSWKGLFAIPPAYHGNDIPYYFYNPASPPPYNNTQFITAFSQSFMSLAKYYDANVTFDPSNITPNWNKYFDDDTEMVFNCTESGMPDIQPIQTSESQLYRCAFWSGVTAQTAQ